MSASTYERDARGRFVHRDPPGAVTTPVYDALVAELGDPENMARDVDEALIRWHVAHPREE